MASTLADINSQIKKHDEQIAQLRKQAEDLRNQERAGVIEELRKKIAEYGLSATDLKLGARVPASAVRAAPAPKSCGQIPRPDRRNLVRWPWPQAALGHRSPGRRQVAVRFRDQVSSLAGLPHIKKPASRAFSTTALARAAECARRRDGAQFTITSLPLTPRDPMWA